MTTSTQCQYRTLKFIVPGEPVGKGRPRFTRSGHTYTPQKTIDYENQIKRAYRHNYTYCSKKALRIKIIAYSKIAKSTSKKRKELMLADVIKCTKKPDVDNIQKIVLDALNNVAYLDDTQVVQVVAIKKWDEEEKLKIIIEEIGERMQKD